jgi:hypothetical protein
MFQILKIVQIFRSSNKASRENRKKPLYKTEKSVQHKQKKRS